MPLTPSCIGGMGGIFFENHFYNNKNDLWSSVFNATDPILADNIINEKMPLSRMVEPFFNFHF